ncbi:hypothetical protein Zm00014a_004167 [Zea mays]|uniref:Uncharacterized protein n=1 Tax=Zea mays TaxID=4577 RepID=A0A3L6EPB3_MAIZE|nr:hypothetical protein Zm00014a_004167 [Zea mays]
MIAKISSCAQDTCPFLYSLPQPAQASSDGYQAVRDTTPHVRCHLSPSPVAAPAELEGDRRIDGGRRGGIQAGAEGGAEARRRGRHQAAFPRLRGGRVPRPRRLEGRR